MKKHTRNITKRGIYLLPNAFTTAGLFSGFYAVVAALKGMFDVAAIAIFVGMIFDGFDGRIARLTGTESMFGAEYDSLSDLVTFGIAPSLVLYSWALAYLGKPGWVAAFIFTVCGALRLARFNTQVGDTMDKRYFQGLPIPAAAGTMAGFVWFFRSYDINMSYHLSVCVAILTTVVGLLMISKMRYYSFKELNFKHSVPFFAMMLIVIILATIALAPPTMLFIIFLCYAISGFFTTGFYAIKRRKLQLYRKQKRQ